MTNEQKYKTVEERNHAFSEWCFNRDCESCKLQEHNFDGGDGCRFYWLALEAEEEKPEPCPFCGGECRTVVNQYEDHVVGCDNCCYCSREFNSDSEAIAAHNRVARAVMDEKEETK